MDEICLPTKRRVSQLPGARQIGRQRASRRQKLCRNRPLGCLAGRMASRVRYSTGFSASTLLKWLNSLYRPALPDGSFGKAQVFLVLPAVGASPSGKAVDFDSTIRRFESSRPSQPVRRKEILPSMIPEMPANGGLLRICDRSPDSKFGRFQGEIANSLRQIFEIFPFSRDGGRRPGSICTAWPTWRCGWKVKQ